MENAQNNDNSKSSDKIAYQPPQAVRLTDASLARGADCLSGAMASFCDTGSHNS
jgi:hypothetical protein